MNACQYCDIKIPAGRLQCPKCKKWQGDETVKKHHNFILLKDVKVKEQNRLTTGPWDEIWGSNWKTGKTGIVLGSLNMLAGLRGCGKSTLALQIASTVSQATGQIALCLSSEEPNEQIKDRADRLELNVDLIGMVSLMGGESDDIEGIVKEYNPCMVFLDSSSDLAGENLQSEVSICKTLKNFCAQRMIPGIVLSHVNKTGDVAGLEKLQHAVDSVTTFFPEGEGEDCPRVLHVEKNRNGKAMINYALTMTTKGLVPFIMNGGETDEDEDDSEEESNN